ncbi:DUF6304 family protein [Clostridium sp. C2-6-12]|uniref:DUF6304 family protein n=1 Tax=Clostridium sp. C2-6-12 TaxID=2698832 RepID=UPI00136DA17B|nr:DUF6304 family protein [Clostridium sp. C2-6-12]
MVKLKYAALYTDNLGCEQATVYFSREEFLLKVRGYTFKNDSLNFEFYGENSEEFNEFFYLKDDELIDYVLDVKIPITLIYNNEEIIKEFFLRVERRKNYYNNSLSLCLKESCYKVEGYDLRELFIKMQKELPEGCYMEDYFSNMFGGSSRNFFNIETKNQFNKLQRIPITYVSDEYCLS